MNREIKFKAWDTIEKCWIDDLVISENDGWIKGNERIQALEYTGLKDKNGKEIYEGDIIKRYTGYVFEMKIRKYSLGMVNDATAIGYDWHNSDEVIGNIYENPELIK
jgi:hypothetical protein